MYSIILCGGSGTRLWPLSRKNYPKHFLSLYSDKSLLQETYLRMRKIMPKENIYFSTGKDNFFNVLNQIKEVEKDYDKKQVIAEPMARNTAPAMALSVKYLAEKMQIDPNDSIIFLPADHYIKDIEKFAQIVKGAMQEVGSHIGTVGITPVKPVTGYGYIRKGEKSNGYNKVLEFKEKPDKETAKKYVDSGEYVWNSGMFIFNVNTFQNELEKNAPEIFDLYKEGYENFLANFEKAPSISIDYAIAEKSSQVIVFEGDFGWNDIGSFDSLAEIKIKDKNPRHLNFDSKNVYVHTDSNRLVVTLGIEDINIVETADSILVQKQGRAEEVKKIVEYLKENDKDELEHNLIEYRPWGVFWVLFDGPTFKVKKFVVYPRSKLSLQSHKFRSEHWVVVKGAARITKDDEIIDIKEGESTFVSQGTKHRFENPTDQNAEFVEIQLGSYLGEDDIERYEDQYGRMSGMSDSA